MFIFIPVGVAVTFVVSNFTQDQSDPAFPWCSLKLLCNLILIATAPTTRFSFHQQTQCQSIIMPGGLPFVAGIRFRPMPLTKLVLQPPEQLALLPWPSCIIQAYISMPDLKICEQYVDWIDTYPDSDTLPYCFHIQKMDIWLQTNTQEDLRKMKESFLKHGHPPDNWIYDFNLTNEDPY